METDSESTASHANQHLEPFLILGKSVHGAALRALIVQVLEANNVYVFGEFLELPCITEAKDEEDCKLIKLLRIFASGTFSDYITQASCLPPLTPAMSKKLKCLTIVTLAASSKYISYKTLLQELDMKNIRELEDLLISAIYADIIHGRLDQQNSRLEVDWTIGRDLTPDDMNYISDTLTSWCTSCETMLRSIQSQVVAANAFLAEDANKKAEINTEVENIKSTIKKTSGNEFDLAIDSRSSSQHPAPSAGVEIKRKQVMVEKLKEAFSKTEDIFNMRVAAESTLLQGTELLS